MTIAAILKHKGPAIAVRHSGGTPIAARSEPCCLAGASARCVVLRTGSAPWLGIVSERDIVHCTGA